MKNIFNNWFVALLLAFAVAVASCTKDNFTDGDKFMLYYPDITDIGPSTNMDMDPTYHGAKPTDFNVYDVKYNGSTIQTECFQVDPVSGRLMIKDTETLGVGVYTISISCKSSGTTYTFPDIIKVNMMRAVPEGITVEPSEIVLMMTQVNNVNSTEVLPTAQVTTDGNHVTIKSYRIANITRDGVRMEDWSGFFSIDQTTGLISIIKNGSFVAGRYEFDLRLVTAAANASSEEGIFADALAVDIVSPPVSLAYDPQVKRVEEGSAYVSAAPSFVASLKDLKFEIKAVYPENVPLTIDQTTGAISLNAENGLSPGDEVQISIKVTNAYGTKDFDQVTRIDIVDYIEPITKLAYNDSTVWHGTAYGIKPIDVDGDDVKFSFVDLPEALAELSIDEVTGQISAVKGNKIEKGEYTVTVKVANDKGELTEDIAFKVIDNPYFFTKVSWGNNLGLSPVSDYASQHRITTFTDDIPVALDKVNSDITETGWEKVTFEIVGGSGIKDTDALPTYVKIDAATGNLTVLPSKIGTTKVANLRAHMAIVKITCGEGTSGETVKKVPVFFDFNLLRQDSAQPNAPAYTVEFTPFVFQCNPKKGGTFVQPTFKDADGNVVDPVASQITMTMHGPNKQYYWNIDGPATHLDGIPSVEGGFLHMLWTQYGADANVTPNYGNAYPVYKYLEDKAVQKYASARIGYMQDDLKMYIKKDKWIDSDGNYADGIFTSQVRMGYTGLDGTVKRADATTSPYNNMFPFFIWFDTEFDIEY